MPFPLYTGLLVHLKTRKKGLVNMLARNGLSVSYERLKGIQTFITKRLCKKYKEERVVCPPKLREGFFTTAAIENNDNDLSSTTATQSFHGTSVSIF